MSEYHKIETAYNRDPATFKVTKDLRNPVYGLLKSWRWTEKIDGTNIRVIFKDGKLDFGGKTKAAQIHADLVSYLYGTFTADTLIKVFPDGNAVIYGEGYGPGIQNGGNLADSKRFIAFDVRVGDFWLSHANVQDVCAKLGIEMVPDYGDMTLEDATEMVRKGFPSRLNGGKAMAEGLVGRPMETLRDNRGERLIIKLKTKDFV